VQIVANGGPRYNPSDFDEWAKDPKAKPTAEVGELRLDPNAEPPADRFQALLANDSRCKATWERTRTDLHDSSPSGYCWALATAAVQAGWTDQEVCDLLVAWRARHKADRKPVSWYVTTISNVRAGQAEHPTLATDGGNAERFAREHGADLRYCHPWRKWLAWDGSRFPEDQTGEVDQRAKQTTRAMLRDAAKIADDDKRKKAVQWALASDSRAKREAMIVLATSEPRIPITPDQLDRDPWLFNVANGTIDLKTGNLRPHSREDLLTKIAPVEYLPNATRPMWERFIADVLPDPDVRRFVQKAVGYSLTGSIREQIMLFLYGTGANGKSVLLTVLLWLLGDYGMQATPDVLVAHGTDRHPTELADLCGKRLVATIEVEEGRQLAESLVKWLTGGDTIRARRLYENHWSFQPTHHIWLVANHRPVVRGQDYALWRRLRLVPFTVTIPEEQRDPDLAEKLKDEAAGILAWAVEGCLAWQREGLQAPVGVKVATDTYKSEQDTVGRFITDKCIEGPHGRVKAGDLYREYRSWAEAAGERPMTQTAFGTRLGDRGLAREKDRTGWWWVGLALVTTEHEDDPVTGVTGFGPFSGNFPARDFTKKSLPNQPLNPSQPVTRDRVPGEDDMAVPS
jgi:putative DNA primase/helicase